MTVSDENNAEVSSYKADFSEFELIDRRAIYLAYRFMLGRAPESDARLDGYIGVPSIDQLRDIFKNSREFKHQIWNMAHQRRAAMFCTELEAAGIDAPHSSSQFEIKIIQTCDNAKYVPFLQNSSKTIIEYIKCSDMSYDAYVGIKRGAHPHHAMLNRIFMLNEYIDAGYSGWILYMDSDAIICDFDFDLNAYISGKDNYAFLFAKAEHSEECPFWNVNTGVFFANLRHPVCVEIIRQWRDFYDSNYEYKDYMLGTGWNDVVNDQTSLHQIIRMPCFEQYISSSGDNSEIFNSGYARFIRQFIRSNHESVDDESFERRLERMKTEIDRLLSLRRQNGLD